MNSQRWNGIERRKADTDAHKHAEESISDIQDMLLDLKSAFPNGDFDGHRKSHEAMIKAAEAQEKFWDEVKLEFVKKGLMAGILLVGSVLIVGLWYKAHVFFNGNPPQ